MGRKAAGRPARIRSFPPIADGRSQVLILGSMPGRASLAAAQYYAHPQNAFWRIAAELLGFDAGLPYPARARALRARRIAVWDVLQSCEREGSLDSRIENEVANDLSAFFRAHRRIRRVFFNGAKAEASFRRHVPAALGAALVCRRLPSTSPANASQPYGRKLAAWRAILQEEEGR
jgi:hypoxanthine-DNA glycosylase